MTTYEWITTLLLPVSNIVTWLASTRVRRNETIKSMQTTIDMLVEKNSQLYDDIARLRQENDMLRDQGIKRDNEIAELKIELERLKK